jgi:deazaflavin-dependent oxidoreductase (nitroreductase family)
MAEPKTKPWEDAMIADMREHNGPPTNGPLAGHPILVMHVLGAKSGEPRRALLTYSRDGDDYVLAGTAGGSRKDPSWLANVRVHPDVTFDIGRRSFEARASIAHGEERERLWHQHVDQLPWFAEYPAQVGREIPMIRLTVKHE